ncbi:GIDE domain-containing protein [Nocardiopsis sp. ATB16-24]|uniref:GIDE domain-containing protein n=1 Tax=Nocardiopsis sp. ATB16-24 TaxID=3019555 RepID=UPI0025566956|nr:GIDE domain-containing protein [Nocardiopsis sp. ATB16-24]
MLLVIGSVLLVVAAVLLPLTVLALRRWLRLHRRDLTRPRPGALTTMEGRRVTLTGEAAPGPGGPLVSGLAGVECVWHGHEVLRHYWSLNREPREGRPRERVCDSIADYGSEDLFELVTEGDPDTEPILVDPRGTRPRGAELCLKRLVGRPQPGVASPADDLLPRVKGRISGVFRGETIEFEYREWVLRPGSRVRVTGQVRVRDGQVVLTAPEGGTLGIEHGVGDRPTRVPPRRREALMVATAFVVCAVTGAALTVAAL